MEKIRSGTRKVKFTRLNWDAEFYNDIYNGKSFIISEPAEMSNEGTRRKSLYGAQSPLYGTSYEDEHAFAERWRCDCGKFTSRLFEGEICPFCGTPVEAKDSDINICGWISLGDTKIINPYYYKILQNALGKQGTIFSDIVNAKYKVNIDGQKEKLMDDEFEDRSSIYAGIGTDEFYNRYEEIIKYFMTTRKSKYHTLEMLLDEKDKVFTSHIPISSTMLRPQAITSNTFYFNSVDKLINTLFSLSENVKNCIDVERDYIIQRIQTKVNQMWDLYFETLKDKEGLIRGEILGGSLDRVG